MMVLELTSAQLTTCILSLNLQCSIHLTISFFVLSEIQLLFICVEALTESG